MLTSGFFNPSKKRSNIRKENESKVSSDAATARKFIPQNRIIMASEEEVQLLKTDTLWISPETEVKLLKDLLYIFQGLPTIALSRIYKHTNRIVVE